MHLAVSNIPAVSDTQDHRISPQEKQESNLIQPQTLTLQSCFHGVRKKMKHSIKRVFFPVILVQQQHLRGLAIGQGFSVLGSVQAQNRKGLGAGFSGVPAPVLGSDSQIYTTNLTSSSENLLQRAFPHCNEKFLYPVHTTAKKRVWTQRARTPSTRHLWRDSKKKKILTCH